MRVLVQTVKRARLIDVKKGEYYICRVQDVEEIDDHELIALYENSFASIES